MLKRNGVDDLSQLLNEEQKSALGGDGFGDSLSMIHDMVPALKGKEYLIDPRLFGNYHAYLESCLPGTNALCTARGLASVYDAVFSEDTKVKKDLLSILGPDFESNEINGPFSEGRVGLRCFSFRQTLADGETGKVLHAYGQFAFGGSLVFSIPELSLTVAVVTNFLTMERNVTESVLNTIYDHFSLDPIGDF